jgi:uncharacterized protein YegL
MRRLPIYFLIDVSETMVGEPIEEVKNGLKYMISTLLDNYGAIETAYISVITFNSVANQLTPLSDLVSFQMKDINTAGVASLGSGLNLLSNCIENEVIKKTLESKGDWEPIVFLMTDDNLLKNEDFQTELNNFKSKKQCNLIVCISSNKSDVFLIKNISDEIIVLSGLNIDSFKKQINWKNQDGVIESYWRENNSVVTNILLILFIVYVLIEIFN